MSKVVERFIKYVKFDTKANDDSNTVPSTPGQLVLAKELGKELEQLGLSDVSVDDNGYVMATLPSNIDRKVPTVGFIAHMDTSPDMSGTNVSPRFIENYDGGDIKLNDEVTLSPAEFTELKEYIGETLITTDGTTLLGADDKAGIAEIITAVEYLIEHPELPHGTIKIGFTPDEEIGRGPNHFDVQKFGADLAYTMDGGAVGELEYENFNAAGAKVTIHGRNVHPGYAKNKMVNSVLIANEFITSLPESETPQTTEGYEGFYHLNSINGDVEKTVLSYIIRDFDQESFEGRKKHMAQLAEELNKKYPNRVSVEIKDQYKNMREKIEPVMYVVDNAVKAMEQAGVKALVRPIRGGTGGARLSFVGLPTPNIFAGGLNFHGKYEYVPVSSMEKAVQVILNLADLYANK